MNTKPIPPINYKRPAGAKYSDPKQQALIEARDKAIIDFYFLLNETPPERDWRKLEEAEEQEQSNESF